MLPHKGKARIFQFSFIPIFLFCFGPWSEAIPSSSFSYSQYSSHRNGFTKKNTNFSLVEQEGNFPRVLRDRRADDFPSFQGRMPDFFWALKLRILGPDSTTNATTGDGKKKIFIVKLHKP